MGSLKQRESVSITFENYIDSEPELIWFFATICEIKRASSAFSQYEYRNNFWLGRLRKREQEYNNLSQYISGKNLLKTDFSKVSFFSFFSDEEKEYFVFHPKYIRNKFDSFLKEIECDICDIANNKYNSLTVYRIYGEKLFDNTLPNEQIKLIKVSRLSKRYIRAFYDENHDAFGPLSFFVGLIIASFVMVINDWGGGFKVLAAGFLAFLYFLITFGLLNYIAAKIFTNEDRATTVGCVSSIICGVIPAFLLFSAAVDYHPNDAYNVIHSHHSSSVETHGLYGGYNTSLSDSYLTEDAEVFITKYGSCYHVNPNCMTLSKSTSLTKTTKKKALKNNMTPCHICTAK